MQENLNLKHDKDSWLTRICRRKCGQWFGFQENPIDDDWYVCVKNKIKNSTTQFQLGLGFGNSKNPKQTHQDNSTLSAWNLLKNLHKLCVCARIPTDKHHLKGQKQKK